jgi:hypothetical protein
VASAFLVELGATMTSIRAVVLSLAVMTFSACGAAQHQSTKEPSEEADYRSDFSCSWEARRKQFCNDISVAEVFGADDRQLALHLVACDVNVNGAILRWSHSRAGTISDTEHVILFGDDGGVPLVPEALVELQRSWPSALRRDSIARVSAVVSDACSGRQQALDLAVPESDRAQCLASAWLVGESTRWCVRDMLPGSELYMVDTRPWNRSAENVEVVVLSDRVTVRNQGESVCLSEQRAVTRVREQLAKIWDEPQTLREGCRDGGLVLVRALRSTGWLVLQRSCSDPVGILALVRDLLEHESSTCPPANGKCDATTSPGCPQPAPR